MAVNTSLPDLIAGVTQLLKRKKYCQQTLEAYHLTWGRIQDYMTAQNISGFTKDVGEAFFRARFGDHPYEELKMNEKNCIYHTMVLWYYQLNQTLPPHASKKHDILFSGKLGELFNEFFVFKAETCAPPTLRLYRYHLFPFYHDLLRADQDVCTIDGTYIVRFLSRLDTMQKVKEKNRIIEQTRMFLIYLCGRNLLSNNKALFWVSVLKPRSIKQPKIPSVYSSEEVERLIKAIDRGNPQGKRDYAIVLLAARYGLRGSDIMGLRHHNLDWSNNRIIVVQQKTAKKVELPLSEEVGHAVIDYLKFGRPVTDEPYIFLTAKPPFGKMITIHKIITKHMRRADISYKERKHGPHALRHSLASNLLALHEPMPVISSILGHSTLASTTPYLRVDFDQLKQCTLEVPCVPSSFYNNFYEKTI